MSNILRFTHKSISIFILLMLVTSSIRPYSASAQVAAKGNIAPSPNQTMVANAVPLGANVIQDSGLEESYGTGYPGHPWGSQPGTLCIYWDEYCNIPGVGYHSGGAWALFGRGTDEFIYQDVTFPRCGATLKFYLYIGEYAPGAGWGMDNYIIGYIDSRVIFTAHGYDINSYQPYQLVGIDVSEFADGATHLVEFYGVTPDYGTFFNIDDIALYATNTKNCAEVAVKMGGSPQGTYGIPQNGGDRQSFPVNNGPVFVNSTNNVPFVASERVAYVSGGIATSFSELMGLPQNLVSNIYSFPAYDNLNFNSQLRFGNVSNAPITVRVYIGRHEMTSGCLADGQPSNSPYTLGPGASLRVSCPGVNGGPAVVQSTGGNIVAALRVIPNVYNGSFSEIMGLPQSQVGTTYLFPWYNYASLNTQLRIGNVSGSTASVRLYIGVNEMTSGCTTIPSKLYPYTLAAGTAVRVSCPGVNSGPVRVVGTGNIVASERVAYLIGNIGTYFSELMGLPEGQLTRTYHLPWYNNLELDTQLRIGNVSGSPATVHVYIAGQEMTSGCLADGQPSNSPYALAAGASKRVSCPGVNNGPVKIVSDNGNIIAAERVVINNGGAGISFSELMGLPQSRLTTGYVFPWYNNTSLNTQLRFGVP
jgi:hypothetical protein